MGTGVSESVEVTVDIECTDFPAVDRDDFALPGRHRYVDVISIKVFFTGDVNRVSGVVVLAYPQIQTTAVTRHISMAKVGQQHATKVFDVLDVMSRQVGEKSFVV
jgi:hypothetical protein